MTTSSWVTTGSASPGGGLTRAAGGGQGGSPMKPLLSPALGMVLESPLDYKEIQPVHSKGDQFWVFIGRTDVEAETPILWPPDAKS